MAVNKVVYAGETLIDITDATLTPETLLEGYTGYNAAGLKVSGTASYQPKITKYIRPLTVSAWTAYGDYFRLPLFSGQETNAKFDLQFDIDQLIQLQTDGVTAIVAANEDGTVYVYCSGAKPTTTMSIQVTKTLLF